MNTSSDEAVTSQPPVTEHPSTGSNPGTDQPAPTFAVQDCCSTLQTDLAKISLWHLRNPGKERKDEDADTTTSRTRAMICISSLAEGEVDPWTQIKIKHIVRKSTKFIIFLDEQDEIQWWWITKPNDENLIAYAQAQITRLQHESDFLARSNDLRKATRFPFRTRAQTATETDRSRLQTIRALIAEGMAIVLNNGTQEQCDRVLRQAEEQILLAKDHLCRPAFFLNFLIAIAAITVPFIALLYLCPGKTCLEWSGFPRRWHEGAIAGAVGAFAFSIMRSRQLLLEPNSQYEGIKVDALARATIGAVAGVLASLAFDSGLFVKEALQVEGREPLRLLLCLAAGFSERLLPSLVTRSESLMGAEAKTASSG